MFKYFQNRLALSEKGSRDLVKGVFFTFLHYLSFMFPTIFVYFFLQDYLQPLMGTLTSPQYGFSHYLLIGLAMIGVMYFIARLQYRSTYSVTYNESAKRRVDLAEKLRKLPLAYFGEKNLSDLTATIMDDCTQLETTFSHAVPQLFASLLSLTVIALGLFNFHWKMALSLFWVVPLSAVVLILSRRAMDRAHSNQYSSKRDVSEQIQEGLETIQEMKAYHREEEYISRLDENLKDYESVQIKGELLVGSFLNLSHILLKLGLVSVAFVGAVLLEQGGIDLFTYLIFLMISASVYNPVIEVFNHMAVLVYLDVRIGRMKEMEALPVQQGTTEFEPKNFDIEFRNVEFSYDTGKKVLHDVSFTAEQGQATALVGPSGGGKSTTAKLAARFWDIDGGRIFLDGTDISTVDPETLLKYYSVVFQDVVLFNASVADNIRIGKKDATDEEVREAARLAQCHDFIEKMPQGYDTVIGENGETISGGERQRISIARALLKDAPIVLLDEATASVDVENETKIQRAISHLIKDRTLILIAHRMRTIAHADKIVLIKEGEVAESGRPEELLEEGGLFAGMVEAQRRESNSKVLY
ncbi:MAG: ABC transporter ATP-binding protein [Spirochaetales bacterium]|nr:ABC transporter ATP-binding protein [Spirochaetales bacterium]